MGEGGDKKNLNNDGVSHILRTALALEEVTAFDIRKAYKQVGKRQVTCNIQTILSTHERVVRSIAAL